jgi:hypothetical protein
MKAIALLSTATILSGSHLHWLLQAVGAFACIAVHIIKSTCHVRVSGVGSGMKAIVLLFAADVTGSTRAMKFGADRSEGFTLQPSVAVRHCSATLMMESTTCLRQSIL